MNADKAIIQLSALAADFKVGIVSDEFVVGLLSSIVRSMDIENKDEVLKKALACWFIGEDEDVYGA
jgi:hypothetical protein